ncbi:MAG: DUF3617 family protein [Reyranella sp.]|nr:DUF3617 family protein [Reyranella sp.]
MKSFAISVMAAAALMAGPAGAQTAIQAGLWETNDKTTMEGVQPIPATSRKVCLKAAEAQLERLLFPSPEEMKQHGCTYEGGLKQPGVLKSTLSCPPNDEVAGIDAQAEITFSSTSYEGQGQIVAKDKAGTTLKGSSVLAGKRVGDC